ncbi:unnamed protein product [Ectocarpus sp. 12 AP-2014]
MQVTNTGGAEADREMHGIAKEEHADCTATLEKLRLDLTSLLLPRDEGDSKNALLEVRSGSGGDEAAAFAKELFEMYRRFAELKGWKFEGMTCSSIDAGERVNLRFRRRGRDGAGVGEGDSLVAVSRSLSGAYQHSGLLVYVNRVFAKYVACPVEGNYIGSVGSQSVEQVLMLPL